MLKQEGYELMGAAFQARIESFTVVSCCKILEASLRNTAEISFDFPLTDVRPRVSRSTHAHADTECNGDFPAAESNDPRKIFPSNATVSPLIFPAISVTQLCRAGQNSMLSNLAIFGGDEGP